jgi:hypothetical protein
MKAILPRSQRAVFLVTVLVTVSPLATDAGSAGVEGRGGGRSLTGSSSPGEGDSGGYHRQMILQVRGSS